MSFDLTRSQSGRTKKIPVEKVIHLTNFLVSYILSQDFTSSYTPSVEVTNRQKDITSTHTPSEDVTGSYTPSGSSGGV